jgi:hypothetical protein
MVNSGHKCISVRHFKGPERACSAGIRPIGFRNLLPALLPWHSAFSL